MKTIMTLLTVMMYSVVMSAEQYNYNFNSTRLSEALSRIAEENPTLNLNFIYNELDLYKTTAKIHTDNAYDALRKTVGLNPVSIIKKGNRYYVEALQHGQYVYYGRAIGSENEPVVAATVMLLVPKDSTVITYGITDDTGHFSIPCDSHEVIAKLSCIGFKTTYRKFDSYDVGTIRMIELPIQLKTITVEGANASLLSDRSIYRPTQRQKNASQTAIDLLRNLAIPQVNINLVDESVTTLAGGTIAIYINGQHASVEELTGMRTSDVKAVEYLDFPVDPRFNGNEHVINFIMQAYEYGGYTKLSINENLMIGLSSRTSLYSKFSYKRMIFDLYAGTSNQIINNGGTSSIEKYMLGDSNNSENTIIRHEESDKSHFKYNQYPVSLRAIYDSDNIQIGNTVGVNFDQSPIAENQGKLTFYSNNHDGYTYKNNQPYTSRHLVWSGAYYFVLPNEIQLSLSPRANYGHTDYSYFYSTSIPGNQSINNISKENYYSLSGGVSLYKGFLQKHSITSNIYVGTNRNIINYMGSSHYDNDFSDSFAGIRIGYNYNNRKWRFNTNVALQWERNGINSEYVSEVYPLINVSGSYSPSSNHSLQTFFHYGANYPGESVKTPNILQDNELMYKTGNPNLPLSRQITLNFQYNWITNNKFSMSFYAQFFGEYNLYVPTFEHYKNGTAILRTYSSDQDYNRTQCGLSFNLKLLDGNLQLSAHPSITLYNYKGCYDIKKNPLFMNASATYYIKRFFVQASYQSANKTIQGNYGIWYTTRDFYQLQGGWGTANWNIRLSAINMFHGDWIAATQTLYAPLFSKIVQQCGTYYHRRINLSMTYTFGYGKKIQRDNEVGEQSGASSAILK